MLTKDELKLITSDKDMCSSDMYAAALTAIDAITRAEAAEAKLRVSEEEVHRIIERNAENNNQKLLLKAKLEAIREVLSKAKPFPTEWEYAAEILAIIDGEKEGLL